MFKRALSSLACLSIVCAASISLAHPKIDLFLDVPDSDVEAKALSINVVPPTEVFIKAYNTGSVSFLVHELGGRVGVISGSIITASVPRSALGEIADSDDVVFIEAAKPISFSNDVATAEVGSTEANEGVALPESYTGEGVIIGVIDTGIDYAHPDFADADGVSRVLSVWDQSRTSGTPPSEIQNGYGSECDYESISSNSCTLVDVEGHGTHVAGIVAGNDATYRGVAPNANIIAVKYDARLDLNSGYADTIFSTKICEAAYYVFAKAHQHGLPAVVNLSLGTHLGAHDGTSLFEGCLAGLVEGQAGRALVAAAGNEYSGDRNNTGIHTGFDPEGKTMATNFAIRTLTSDGVYYIDLWGDVGSDLSVGLAVHNGLPDGKPEQRSYMASKGDKIYGSFLGGDVDYLINATESSSPLNGKPHVGIRIILGSGIGNPAAYSFDLVVQGSGGFDAWLFPDKPARTIQFTAVEGGVGGEYKYVPGDREKSIAIPATSPEVIAVAGYATRVRWTANSLTWLFNGQELGEILNFSSAGPSADAAFTGQKPEIAAPGGMIASALSSHTAVSSQVIMGDGAHFLQAGTSMAAPFVSGAIALMFEHDPNFTMGDVRKFLTESAYVDIPVGSVPNGRWGYGKLDVLSAMEHAVDGVASGTFDADGSIAVPSSQSSGSSGCELVAAASADSASLAGLISMAFAAMAIAIRRKM